MACVVALALLLVPAAAACSSAADCFYGGACVSSACACRSEWTGANCSQLRLLAAAGSGVAFPSAPATSSWGGSVARVGRRYWMAVAEFEGHCGLDSWEANSAIRLASAATPEGPYEPGPLLLPPFAHNPTLHATANGSLLIAHIGQGTPYHTPFTNCTNGTTPLPPRAHMHVAADDGAPPLRLGVPGTVLPPPNFLYLPSGRPDDASPWVVFNSSGGNWAMNNPGLLVRADDSALLIYKTHCNASGGVFCAQFGVATAPHWLGPYTDLGLIEVFGEDAYIWEDTPGAAGGGLHMLFQGGNYRKTDPVYVGHWHTAASADGVHWRVEADSMPFNGTIARAQGGALELARRERHPVLFENDAPAYLFNGAMAAASAGDASFTSVQPIATSAQ